MENVKLGLKVFAKAALVLISIVGLVGLFLSFF